MKHIGIYSGTFNPIHEGHVLFAQTAIDQYGLDEVLIMPEVQPRNKTEVTDIDMREAMVRIALEDFDNISLLSNPQTEHSILETMAFVVTARPDAHFSIIMGADVFEHIGSWDGYEELRNNVGLIVGLRTEDDGEIVIPLAKELDLEASFLPVPLATISSSQIRRAVLDDLQPKGLNDQVAAYIELLNLYK